MMRYEKQGETISVDLCNGYSVWGMAQWNNEEHQYNVTLYLQDNTICQLRLIEDAENIPLQANRKILYSKITKLISQFNDEGFFESYITKYKYEMSCFDMGNESLEKRRLNCDAQ